MEISTPVEAPPLEGQLISVVYVSSAVELFSREALLELLQRARDKNARLGITGMLLYKAGNFMQALEGSTEAVHNLYSVIDSDPRHKGVDKILEHIPKERQFPDWAMGFTNLDSVQRRDLAGYSEILNQPLNSGWFREDPTRSQRLLLSFRRNM